jgi:hypothetical protein
LPIAARGGKSERAVPLDIRILWIELFMPLPVLGRLRPRKTERSSTSGQAWMADSVARCDEMRIIFLEWIGWYSEPDLGRLVFVRAERSRRTPLFFFRERNPLVRTTRLGDIEKLAHHPCDMTQPICPTDPMPRVLGVLQWHSNQLVGSVKARKTRRLSEKRNQ